jgi:hypothetical protein
MIAAVKLAVALAIAVPLALGVTAALMRVAERANRAAWRWDTFVLGKPDRQA